MPTNFFNYKKEQVKNQKTGYRNKAFVALSSWMSNIAEPLPGTYGEDAKTATGDHAFIDDMGFIEVYCLPKSVGVDGESAGNTGAADFTWKPKFFILGDTPGLQQMLEEGLLNEELVLLVEDPTCPDGGYRQFGCDCSPLFVTDIKFEGESRKGWAVQAETTCRFFYEGEILILGQVPVPKMNAPGNFQGTVANEQSVLTWNAVTSPVPATNYQVKKNGTVIYSGPSLNYTATGLTNGTAYNFSLVAQAVGHTDSNPATRTITPAIPTLSLPSAISITPGNASAELSFTLPSGATGAKIYTNTTNSSTGATLKGAFTSPADVTGLANGTQHYFFLKATGAGYNDSGFTASISATPTGPVVAPTLLSAVIEDVAKDVVKLTFSTDNGLNLSTSSVPVAADFNISGLSQFIKGTFPARKVAKTSACLYGRKLSAGVFAPKFPTGAANWPANGNLNPMGCLNRTHSSRIRLRGLADRIKFDVKSVPNTLTAFKFQIWKPSTVDLPSTFTKVYEEDILPKMQVGLHEIMLAAPVQVGFGYHTGYVLESSGFVPPFLVNDTYGNPGDERNGIIYYPFVPNNVQTWIGSGQFFQDVSFTPIEVFITEGADTVFRMDSRGAGFPMADPNDPNWMPESFSQTIGYKLENRLDIAVANLSYSGNTTEDMLANFTEVVLASNPNFCIIGASQNGTEVSEILAMIDLCLANSITPIVWAILPHSAYDANTLPINAGIQTAVATKPGAIFWNGRYSIGDPNNNHYTIFIDYAADGAHQNGLGNDKILDDFIPDVMLKLIPVTITGKQVFLKAVKAFSFSDTPQLSFTGTRIKDSTGVSTANQSNIAIVNNILQAPEYLDMTKYVGANGGYYENGQHIWAGQWGQATKMLPSNTPGYIYIKQEPIQDAGWITFIKTYDQFINQDIINPNDYFSVSDFGVISGNNQVFWTKNGYSPFQANASGYYAVFRDGAGEITIKYSADEITWTQIYNFTNGTPYNGPLWVIGKGVTNKIKGLGLITY